MLLELLLKIIFIYYENRNYWALINAFWIHLRFVSYRFVKYRFVRYTFRLLDADIPSKHYVHKQIVQEHYCSEGCQGIEN